MSSSTPWPDNQILIFTRNYPLVMAIRSTNVYEERGEGRVEIALIRQLLGCTENTPRDSTTRSRKKEARWSPSI